MTRMSHSITRRTFVAGIPFVAAGSASAAAGYPNKPIRLIVPFQAGGATDIFARVIADGLGKRLGQPVLVENRLGAGGIIATDHVAKSAADGHTLIMTTPATTVFSLALYSKLPYDPRTDLRMVSDLAQTRAVLAVHPSVPAHDFASLIATIQAAPDRYAMGSWGPGTFPNQIQVYMNKTYGLKILHVPYTGEGPMAVDLIGGVIHMTAGTITTLQPHIASGKLRAIAVVGTQRAKALAQISTFAEQGYPDPVYAASGPTSVMAPASTPDAIVERIGREIQALVLQPEVRRRFEELGAEPIGNLPAEAAAAYKAYFPIAFKMTQDTGVQLD